MKPSLFSNPELRLHNPANIKNGCTYSQNSSTGAVPFTIGLRTVPFSSSIGM
jgi:hypothetical protein